MRVKGQEIRGLGWPAGSVTVFMVSASCIFRLYGRPGNTSPNLGLGLGVGVWVGVSGGWGYDLSPVS